VLAREGIEAVRGHTCCAHGGGRLSATMGAMNRRSGRVLVVTTLILWVVSGPIGMAFNGCAAMGTMCEAPCGISSYMAAPIAAQIGSPVPIASLDATIVSSAVTVAARPPSPPPKLALRSA
jgi:hypothetical protein